MEGLLLKKLKEHAASRLGTMSLLVLIAIFLFISSSLTYRNDKSELDLFIFSLIFLVLAIGLTLTSMIPHFLDYKSIRNKSYVTLTAVVSRFDYHESGYEPMEKIWFPVFVDLASGKPLTVETDEKVEVGKQYSIVYLPKTKIAVLKTNR